MEDSSNSPDDEVLKGLNVVFPWNVHMGMMKENRDNKGVEKRYPNPRWYVIVIQNSSAEPVVS